MLEYGSNRLSGTYGAWTGPSLYTLRSTLPADCRELRLQSDHLMEERDGPGNNFITALLYLVMRAPHGYHTHCNASNRIDENRVLSYALQVHRTDIRTAGEQYLTVRIREEIEVVLLHQVTNLIHLSAGIEISP